MIGLITVDDRSGPFGVEIEYEHYQYDYLRFFYFPILSYNLVSFRCLGIWILLTSMNNLDTDLVKKGVNKPSEIHLLFNLIFSLKLYFIYLYFTNFSMALARKALENASMSRI